MFLIYRLAAVATAMLFSVSPFLGVQDLRAAEVEVPTSPSDWSVADRIGFTERWNRANVLNLMRGPAGAAEYRSISQRTDFYNWFDQISKVQGHHTSWPSAAWVVSSQMRNVEDPVRSIGLSVRRAILNRDVDSGRLLQFASDGNKAIFDDVFPRLKAAFDRGLAGQPIVGEEAATWDKETLRREQFEIVQPIYERYTATDAAMAAELTDLASGSDILTVSGTAIANALDFKGQITSAQDRYEHGMNVVIPVYKRFEAAIDGSRLKRQQTAADPTAGGMVEGPVAAAAKRAAEQKKIEEQKQREVEEQKRKDEAARLLEMQKAAAAFQFEQARQAAAAQAAAAAAAQAAAQQQAAQQQAARAAAERAAADAQRMAAEQAAAQAAQQAAAQRAAAELSARIQAEQAAMIARMQAEQAAAAQRAAQEAAARASQSRGPTGYGPSSGGGYGGPSMGPMR